MCLPDRSSHRTADVSATDPDGFGHARLPGSRDLPSPAGEEHPEQHRHQNTCGAAQRRGGDRQAKEIQPRLISGRHRVGTETGNGMPCTKRQQAHRQGERTRRHIQPERPLSARRQQASLGLLGSAARANPNVEPNMAAAMRAVAAPPMSPKIQGASRAPLWLHAHGYTANALPSSTQ